MWDVGHTYTRGRGGAPAGCGGVLERALPHLTALTALELPLLEVGAPPPPLGGLVPGAPRELALTGKYCAGALAALRGAPEAALAGVTRLVAAG